MAPFTMGQVMSDKTRLDEVSIFGDKLRFLIPHDWVETRESDDYYLYHEPNSGWLRVSLISVTSTDPPKKLRESFSDRPGLVTDEETGNFVQTWEKPSTEEGVDTHVYYWKVGNVVPPEIVRVAIFSYTILSARLQNAETKKTVSLLGILLSQAIFL